MAFQQADLLHRCSTISLNRLPLICVIKSIPEPRSCRCLNPEPVSWAGRLRHLCSALSSRRPGEIHSSRHSNDSLHLRQRWSVGTMGRTGVDIISLDWTVDMADGCARLPDHLGVQGNVDPGLLFGTQKRFESELSMRFARLEVAGTSSTSAMAFCLHLRTMPKCFLKLARLLTI